MTNFKTRLTYFWRNVQIRLNLILTACNFSKPLPKLLTQQEQFAQSRELDNQLVELGVGARLPSELNKILHDDVKLRNLVTKKLGEECIDKQVATLLEVVVTYAKSVAQTMPLPDNEEETGRQRVEKWRVERIAPLLLASELILLNEQSDFSLPVFAKHRLSNKKNWRKLVAKAYAAVAKYIDKPTPHTLQEAKNQKLYLYPLIQESDCGIWVGNEHGLFYGPGMSFYLDVSGELCANLLTARGVQIVATLALRHSCGYFPSIDLDFNLFDHMPYKPEKDKHRNKRLSNYIPELEDIYIMGDAHEWTTVAAEAEEAYNRHLKDPTTDNQWQAQLKS